MGSYAANASSLYFHRYLRRSDNTKHTAHSIGKPQFMRQYHMVQANFLHPPLPSQSINVDSKIYSDLPKPCVDFLNSTYTLSAKKSINNYLTEMVAKLLIGSLVLLGSLNARPVAALPVQMSVNIEQDRDTQNDTFDSEVMYMKLLEQDPRNVEALKVLINGKMRKGKIKEAVKDVERLIDIEPDEVEWRLLQALCYEMAGQLSKAKRLFKEILKERPLMLRALHGLAMVMHKNHEGLAVFEMLNKALELASRERRVTEERNIRILIAQLLVIKGDLDGGLKKFQDLVNDNPRDFRPYLCQGIVYSLQDKKKEAEEQFKIYRSLVPEEFPQRGFLDDVVLAAKTESRQQLEKEFKAAFSYRK